MKKTIQKKTNSERIVLQLQEIASSLKLIVTSFNDIASKKYTHTEKDDSEYITFPAVTAKSIIDGCNNTIDGHPFLYSVSWYKNEPLYTTEICRPRRIKIPTALQHKGKSYDEVSKLGKLFNFAEIVYLCEHSKEVRKLLERDYTWTCSKTSGGADFVGFGDFDVLGACVSGGLPGLGWDRQGLLLSCSE